MSGLELTAAGAVDAMSVNVAQVFPMPYDQMMQQQIRTAQQRLDDQKALVRRLITQGVPTQSAEDRLRQLEQTLAQLKRLAGGTRRAA